MLDISASARRWTKPLTWLAHSTETGYLIRRMHFDIEKARCYSPYSDADLECFALDESLEETKVPSLDSPVYVFAYSFRKRLADIEGVSYKAAIDGLVKAGILRNDTTKDIESLTGTQVKL